MMEILLTPHEEYVELLFIEKTSILSETDLLVDWYIGREDVTF